MGQGGEQRFKREGNILGRLAHPHIAELIDAGVSQAGQPYLVLEHVEGDQIDRYCDQHRLSVEARIRLFLDVLGAVAQAHANLIVHRDLKPSNVLVRNDGQVKLLDFGIAKLLEGEGHTGEPTPLTVEGGRAMTTEYAAPEQLKGEVVTTATDVYALGVLLYVLLTGQHPAGTGPHTPADLVKAIVDIEPARLSDSLPTTRINPETAATIAAARAATPDKLCRLLYGDLDTIVAKALKKEPAERYPSVTALADDLRRYSEERADRARPRHASLSCGQVCAPEPRGGRSCDSGDRGHTCRGRRHIDPDPGSACAARLCATPG
jgi:serine/threonine-protein kinase